MGVVVCSLDNINIMVFRYKGLSYRRATRVTLCVSAENSSVCLRRCYQQISITTNVVDNTAYSSASALSWTRTAVVDGR